MIPAACDYLAVDSAEAAIAALTEHGDDAKLLAGGHSLIPLMKMRLASPAMLIDIGRVTDLSGIEERDDHIAVGALCRHADIERSDVLLQHAPMLAHVASQVGDPSVRHCGTLGGSLAHGDPASDLPAAALALGATIVVRGAGGERRIDAADFFTGIFETALAADEMLTEVLVPKTHGAGWSYQKFNRRAQDWAIVAAAVQLGATPRVALVNMGPTPLRATAVEQALAAGSSAADAAAIAAQAGDPSSDLNADADYRRHLAIVLTRRAIAAASKP